MTTIPNEILDQLLSHADESFGLSILTDNPMRLQIQLQTRMREHRQAHPEAYRHLSIINSKSPKELYLVNRRTTAEAREAEKAPRHEAPAD